jgi:hypothetical protein
MARLGQARRLAQGQKLLMFKLLLAQEHGQNQRVLVPILVCIFNYGVVVALVVEAHSLPAEAGAADIMKGG